MNKVEIVNRYNSIFSRILSFYHEKSRNKSISYSHVRKAKLFMDAQPVAVLEMTGVKLFQYRDMVQSGDIHLIKHHTDTEKINVHENGYSEAQIADDLVKNVFDSWQLLMDDEKVDFTEQVQELLQLYIQYLLLEKS